MQNIVQPTAPYSTRIDLRDLATIAAGLAARGLRLRTRSGAISSAVSFAAEVLAKQHGFQRPTTTEEAIAILRGLNLLEERQLRSESGKSGRRPIMTVLSREDALGLRPSLVDSEKVRQAEELYKALEEEERAAHTTQSEVKI